VDKEEKFFIPFIWTNKQDIPNFCYESIDLRNEKSIKKWIEIGQKNFPKYFKRRYG
tara:strand:- start:724 stop:891 length:168 start_codon:yes stop_codon:yes gene_type:complete